MNKHPEQARIFRHARPIKLLALDVDGVLTDGKLYFSNDGNELKAFTTLDGQGIKMLQDNGVRVALLTGRESDIVTRRAEDLGIDLLFQSCKNKLRLLEGLVAQLGLTFADTAYVGDDLPDLACIRRVGFGASVPNAHPLVQENALLITSRRGGEGAVREICDWILQAQGHYDDAVAHYY